MLNTVGAVVVTFHPKVQYLVNLAGVRAQAGLLVVVDNGSTEAELAILRKASQDHQFVLIENGSNLGIAKALNIGISYALNKGCEWIALFDQDSTLTDGFIDAMVADFREITAQRPILQIVPRYLDPETQQESSTPLDEDGGPFLTITSGSMFPAQAFDTCGFFCEELFIYCVDDDFSLRIRAKGFSIGKSRNAVLVHHSGHPTYKRILGKTIATKNYRPAARYYYARNKVWLLKHWGTRFPQLIVPTLREFITIPLKITLAEEARAPKLKSFFLGFLHGVVGRMGPL